MRGTLGYTGMEVLDPFLAWHVPYISQEAREEMMQDYATSLRALDGRGSLKFPSLDAFDERLNPLNQGQPA